MCSQFTRQPSHVVVERGSVLVFRGQIFIKRLLLEAERWDQRHPGFGIEPMKRAWVCIAASRRSAAVALGMSPHLSEPCFPQLRKRAIVPTGEGLLIHIRDVA